MTTPLAITGSTGRLGGRVARALSAAGVAQRLVVRDPSRAPSLAGAEVAVASYDDGEATRRALEGVETVFMVSGAESPDRVRDHFRFVDTAVAAGVHRVVYLSFAEASPTATFTLARDHWATEERLRSTGVDLVVVRDNLYLDFFPLMVGEDGVLRGPAGSGRVAAVAQDDIADCVVAVLTSGSTYDGRTLTLTGPQALTLDEVAAVLSAEAGHRPVTFVDETLEEAYASRAAYDAPQWQLDAWVSTYTAIAAGELAALTDDVAEVCGHPPLSLPEVLVRLRSG